jgi:selenocysteine-specific elongation factor
MTAININIGILGHVDSGKTSLVKALSTLLSTAALDKNPQSRERGITLDLGFSAFTRPLPSRLREEALSSGYSDDSVLQFTLVDCPGHASLIRTIIGGAQIIDMMILVVDINKGIQTQTAECLVIGEITTENLILVLNKVDLIPIEDREEKIAKMIKRIRKTMKTTKFPDPSIVITSACQGGEKVAAMSSSSAAADANVTYGIDDLCMLIESTVKIPHRNRDGAFLYAIDHCFPIKGHGTVLTGTILNGSITNNATIEIPQLQLTRKVKSMQMFRKPVNSAMQGDRVAICVTSLDSTLVERGIACQPASVTLAHGVLCHVKKIRFFKFPCRSGAKYHVSIGHNTVIATVYFFGAKELSARLSCSSSSAVATGDLSSTSIPAFDWEEDFEKQEELILAEENFIYGRETIQWAMLSFQQPVYCPRHSLIIGSRLDTDVSEGSSQENVCRIAFSGHVDLFVSADAIDEVKLYTFKVKEAVVSKITEAKAGICREVIAWRLGNPPSTFIEPYIGMTVQSDAGYLGVISALYGSDGKFKVKFPDGARLSVGTILRLRYKKYSQKDRGISQKGIEYDRIASASPESTANVTAAADLKPAIKINPSVEDDSKIEPAASLSKQVDSIEVATASLAAASLDASTSDPPETEPASTRMGKIDSVKKADGSETYLAVVSGAFSMEENIRVWAGSRVKVQGQSYEGVLVGPYAKLGKCKISFSHENIVDMIGENVRIFLNS